MGPAITATTPQHPDSQHGTDEKIKTADKILRCSQSESPKVQKKEGGLDAVIFEPWRETISPLFCSTSLSENRVVRQFSCLWQSLNYFQVTLFHPWYHFNLNLSWNLHSEGGNRSRYWLVSFSWKAPGETVNTYRETQQHIIVEWWKLSQILFPLIFNKVTLSRWKLPGAMWYELIRWFVYPSRDSKSLLYEDRWG